MKRKFISTVLEVSINPKIKMVNFQTKFMLEKQLERKKKNYLIRNDGPAEVRGERA